MTKAFKHILRTIKFLAHFFESEESVSCCTCDHKWHKARTWLHHFCL